MEGLAVERGHVDQRFAFKKNMQTAMEKKKCIRHLRNLPKESD